MRDVAGEAQRAFTFGHLFGKLAPLGVRNLTLVILAPPSTSLLLCDIGHDALIIDLGI
jgi:hypothetical protein